MKPKGIVKNSTRVVTVLAHILGNEQRSSGKIVARETDIPGLVVHRDLDEMGKPTRERWTITHEASGVAARTGIVSFHVLRELLQRIAELDIDWTKPKSEVATIETAKLFREAVESVVGAGRSK